MVIAGDEVAGTCNILHRYLFDRREDLRLPTLFLIDAQGEIVKVYRESIAATGRRRLQRIDASAADRLARAIRFPGALFAPGDGTTSSTAWSCPNKASIRPRWSRSNASRRATRARSRSTTSAPVHEGGQPAEAKAAFERALRLDPSTPTRTTASGRCSRRAAIYPARSSTSERRSRPRPLSRRAEQSRIRAVPDRARGRGLDLYQKALALRPTSPRR